MKRRLLEQLHLPLDVNPPDASKEPGPAPPGAPAERTRSRPSPPGFERFWSAWPTGRKVGRIAAEKAYARALCHRGATLDALLDGLERAKRSQRWADGFVKDPATWLNQGCWEDDLTPAAARGASAVQRFIHGED